MVQKRKYKRLVANKKLRAKKKKSAYKSLDSYLNAVYENNKGYLNIHIEDYENQKKKKSIFKNQVKELLNDINPDTGKRYTIDQAIDSVQRSTLIRKSGERGFETTLTIMKEADPETYKNLRKALGWKNKLSSENSSYVGTEDNFQIYRYRKHNGDVVYIKIKLSPPSVEGSFDVEVVEESKYLGKLKMPKYLQDAYTNVKTEEEKQIIQHASDVVEEILKKYGGRK